jgi:putative serine protease PepD
VSIPPYAHRQTQIRLSRLAKPLIVLGFVAFLVMAGLAGALIAGAGQTSSPTTTVVESAPASAGLSAAPSGPWKATYAQAAAGTVDITVQTTETVATPFGDRTEQVTSLGSGFVVDGRGDIVTAAHVVSGASSMQITFQDGRTRTATILGHDDASDVAVVHVDPAGLTLHPLTLGSSRLLAVGDALAIIGDPLGFDRSLSTGVVSGLDRTIEAPNGFEIAHAIQTDAAMNPGNSGGPLFDSSGRVIGIADQIATGTNQFGRGSTETSTGVGFAVPVDLIKDDLVPLERGQRVEHAYLGIATTQSAGAQPGALVGSVPSGTPGARAGLRAGDLIVAWNGAKMASAGDLISALAAARPGERAELTVVRNGRRITLSVVLGSQPTQAPAG